MHKLTSRLGAVSVVMLDFLCFSGQMDIAPPTAAQLRYGKKLSEFAAQEACSSSCHSGWSPLISMKGQVPLTLLSWLPWNRCKKQARNSCWCWYDLLWYWQKKEKSEHIPHFLFSHLKHPMLKIPKKRKDKIKERTGKIQTKCAFNVQMTDKNCCRRSNVAASPMHMGTIFIEYRSISQVPFAVSTQVLAQSLASSVPAEPESIAPPACFYEVWSTPNWRE